MLGWLDKQRKKFNKATGGGIDFIGNIGPLAQVGSALIGAKAASDSAKASDSSTDLKKLRAEAEAAGFNPLTVLRATGGQGFNKGSSGALASASFWSSFANSAAQIATQFDPMEKRRKQLDMMNTIANIKYTGALTREVGKKPDDGLTYLYNADGSPRLNQFGQHMHIDPQAAAVFPTLQAYMDMSGNNLSLPHEQLLDMNFSSLPTAAAAIEGGKKGAELPKTPSMLQFPRQYQLNNGEWRRQTRAFSFGGDPFGSNPPVRP